MKDQREWLDSLKAGDQVAVVRPTGMDQGARVRSVSHTTKTLIIVDGVKYSRSDGWMPGSTTWGASRLRCPEDVACEIEETTLQDMQKHAVWAIEKYRSKLTLEECRRIIEIVESEGAS